MIPTSAVIVGLVGALLFADAANFTATADAQNRSEVRFRLTSNDSSTPAADFVDSASLRLSLDDRRWQLFAGYTPVFTAPYLFQSGSQSQPILMQGASIGVRWHDRRVQLSLTEDVSYGTENTALLTTVTTGSDGKVSPAQIAAPTETIQFGSSRTGLLATMQLEREWRLSLLAAYIYQGGLNTTSQSAFPVQQGPRFEATLDHDISRIDVLETRFVAQASESQLAPCPVVVSNNPNALCDPNALLTFGLESWKHRLGRDTDLSLGAGFSFAVSRLHPSDPFMSLADPVFEASLTHADGVKDGKRTVRLDLQVEPFVDIRSGTSDYRAQLGASMDLPLARADTHVRMQVWGMQSIQTLDVEPLTLIRADVQLEHAFSRFFAMGVATSLLWEDQKLLPPGPSDSVIESAIVSLQLTVRAPTARF